MREKFDREFDKGPALTFLAWPVAQIYETRSTLIGVHNA